MPAALYRLICAVAVAAGIAAPGAALARAPAPAPWDNAPRYFPPSLIGESGEAAAECLALAIAYEAGLEPPAGQEAVAQVILNRVRDPAYPDTACGVVRQGSHRRTGCQFTFTCDGSLRRARSVSAMAASRVVAARVLAGESADHVRGATHYHADYVSPYWAPSLTRVRQIAAHIFYRPRGAAVRSDGFPIIVALAAERPAAITSSPAAASDPAIRNGAFAPWGLTVSNGPR